MSIYNEILTRRKELVQMGVGSYLNKGSVSNYSAEDQNKILTNLFKDLGANGGFNFTQNKELAFQIVTEVLNEVVPRDVKSSVDTFVELKKFGNNDQLEFRLRNKKIKAYDVAIGGAVRRERIDGGKIRVYPEAVQVAVYEELERLVNGDVDFNELIEIAKEALIEKMYGKIINTLSSIYDNLPSNNKAEGTGLMPPLFDEVLNNIRAYDDPVIVGTHVALASLPIDAGTAPEADKLDIRNQGYLGMYKGTRVIKLDNSFTDSTNTEKVLRDDIIYILPSGKEKPVKVGLQGDAFSRLIEDNADWGTTFEMYFKFGISVPVLSNIGMYKIN